MMLFVVSDLRHEHYSPSVELYKPQVEYCDQPTSYSYSNLKLARASQLFHKTLHWVAVDFYI